MNNSPFNILTDAYQQARSSSGIQPALSDIQLSYVNSIIDNAESQKAVLTVLITSLTKKIELPFQDVRYHKKELQNGYSGRGYDTQHVTPFIKEQFPRYAMKSGSGWLTRSLEQAHPYTLDYPGRIRDISVREAFLYILNDIEEHNGDPQIYLRTIFAALISQMEETNVGMISVESYGVQSITVASIVDVLQQHFTYNYGIAGASRLPVLAIYSAYELLMSLERFNDKKLLQLKSHTTSDIKSGGIGDIEILNESGEYFEVVEIKHDITIIPSLIQDAYRKFFDTSVSRYYLLTTAKQDIDGINTVHQIINQIRVQHGCEVIVNGIIPSLKYYLRLLADPKIFLKRYSNNVQLDFNRDTVIKKSHLRYWNELLESM